MTKQDSDISIGYLVRLLSEQINLLISDEPQFSSNAGKPSPTQSYKAVEMLGSYQIVGAKIEVGDREQLGSYKTIERYAKEETIPKVTWLNKVSLHAQKYANAQGDLDEIMLEIERIHSELMPLLEAVEGLKSKARKSRELRIEAKKTKKGKTKARKTKKGKSSTPPRGNGWDAMREAGIHGADNFTYRSKKGDSQYAPLHDPIAGKYLAKLQEYIDSSEDHLSEIESIVDNSNVPLEVRTTYILVFCGTLIEGEQYQRALEKLEAFSQISTSERITKIWLFLFKRVHGHRAAVSELTSRLLAARSAGSTQLEVYLVGHAITLISDEDILSADELRLQTESLRTAFGLGKNSSFVHDKVKVGSCIPLVTFLVSRGYHFTAKGCLRRLQKWSNITEEEAFVILQSQLWMYSVQQAISGNTYQKEDPVVNSIVKSMDELLQRLEKRSVEDCLAAYYYSLMQAFVAAENDGRALHYACKACEHVCRYPDIVDQPIRINATAYAFCQYLAKGMKKEAEELVSKSIASLLAWREERPKGFSASARASLLLFSGMRDIVYATRSDLYNPDEPPAPEQMFEVLFQTYQKFMLSEAQKLDMGRLNWYKW